MLVQCSRECTPPYLSTGISNLLQPAQGEVVLGQRSKYLAYWDYTTTEKPAMYCYEQYCSGQRCLGPAISRVIYKYTRTWDYGSAPQIWDKPSQTNKRGKNVKASSGDISCEKRMYGQGTRMDLFASAPQPLKYVMNSIKAKRRLHNMNIICTRCEYMISGKRE